MAQYDYDYFVIGGGSGGVRSARIAATHGAKVGLAEFQNMGGTCVNVGCIPKKLMSYASDFGDSFEDAEGFGWDVSPAPFNWQRLIENKNTEIKRLNGIYDTLLGNAGVTVHNGYAKFVDDHTLDIDGKTITAERILIATGGTPRKPRYEGGEHTVTSDDFFALPKRPEHAIIQGGGYIAVEFAHILKGLGTKVTLLYRGEMFLKNFDSDISHALAEEMKKQGVNLLFNEDITKIEKNGDALTVHTSNGTIACDLVLSAIGRNANTASLNLSAAGVEARDNGTIAVNERYETNVSHIYALGDIASPYQLTPVATGEGHALADNLFGPKTDRRISYDFIPTAIFSSPTIGTCGFSEAQARDKGFDVEIYKSSFKPLIHTLSGRDEKTVMKLIVDKATGHIIGCHMMGKDAAEIMQGFAVAMKAGATKADFDATIGIHPTSAEEFVTMRTPVS